MSMPPRSGAGPLAGVRVVELAGGLAVAVAGGLLADLGARVLLVEAEHGSHLRQSAGFHVWGRGKESFAVRDQPAEARRLAAGAGVLLADEEPGRPLHGIAGLTCLISSRFADLNADPEGAGSLAEAWTGLAAAQRGSRPGPYFVRSRPAAVGTGMLAALGCVAGLVAGCGSLTVSHTAGALAMQMFTAVASADFETPLADHDGDPRRLAAPTTRFFEASDGWLVIAAVNPTFWRRLCAALGMEDLLEDPRYADGPYAIPRLEDRNALVDRIAGVIRTQPVDAWVKTLRSQGVIVAPVLRPGSILDLPQTIESGQRVVVEHPRLGRITMPAPVLAFSRSGAPAAEPAPEVGEHTQAHLDPSFIPPRGPTERWPPLSGVRVLESASFAAGPGAAQLLASLGAEVIKVEPPDGDPFRRIGLAFIGVNRGKSETTLDLSTADGQAAFGALVRDADVLIHNVRRSNRADFGLDPARLAGLNPRLITCVVEGFGNRGPDIDLPAIDVVLEALSGGPLIQGGGEPVGYDGGLVDNTAALLAALGVTAALYARDRRGTGEEVGMSLLGATMHRHCESIVRLFPPAGRALDGPDPVGPGASQRLYRASDGWVMIAATTSAGWAALCTVVPGLADSGHHPGDPVWEAEAQALIEKAVGSSTAETWLKRLARAGVAAAPALTCREFLLRAGDQGDLAVARFVQPGKGELFAPGRLLDFDGRATPVLGPAPALAAVAVGHPPTPGPGAGRP